MKVQELVGLYRGYYAVSKESGLRRVFHAAKLAWQCNRDIKGVQNDTQNQIDTLSLENTQLRHEIECLMMDIDRAVDALRQNKEFSTGLAIVLLESALKETMKKLGYKMPGDA